MAGTTFLRSKGGVMDSAEIVGCKVENSTGENLGKIESLMIDASEGRVLYAVLSFGGFLGIGDKLFPVPLDQVQFRVDEDGKVKRCIMDIDKEMLKNAPGYEKDSLPNHADRTFATRVYSHYGSTPWWSE